MVSFDLKVEKANAILRYRRRQKITNLFRFMEVCVFLIMISKLSTQLPTAFKFSGDYFRGLSVALISPRFVFVLGNAIIVILFLKAGQFSAQDETSNSLKIDLYSGYGESCEIIHGEESDKQSRTVSESDTYSCKERKIHRSRSDNLRREHSEESRRILRRSSTETSRKSVNHGEKSPGGSYAEDDMSSEEFRRTVEAFIARQQKSLREEEVSAIVSIGP